MEAERYEKRERGQVVNRASAGGESGQSGRGIRLTRRLVDGGGREIIDRIACSAVGGDWTVKIKEGLKSKQTGLGDKDDSSRQ